jgi:hypothetical protein
VSFHQTHRVAPFPVRSRPSELDEWIKNGRTTVDRAVLPSFGERMRDWLMATMCASGAHDLTDDDDGVDPRRLSWEELMLVDSPYLRCFDDRGCA